MHIPHSVLWSLYGGFDDISSEADQILAKEHSRRHLSDWETVAQLGRDLYLGYC